MAETSLKRMNKTEKKKIIVSIFGGDRWCIRVVIVISIIIIIIIYYDYCV